MPSGCSTAGSSRRALALGALDAAARHRESRRDTSAAWRDRAGRAGAARRADLFGDRVEDAAILLELHQAGAGVGAVAVAEQPLEHRARIVLHRQRSGRRRATRSCLDRRSCSRRRTRRADLLDSEAELERRQLRLLAEVARRRSDRSVVPASRSAPSVFLACTPVSHDAGAAAMIAGAFAGVGIGRLVVEPADHQQSIAERRRAARGWASARTRALARRRPVRHHGCRSGRRPRRGAAAATPPWRSASTPAPCRRAAAAQSSRRARAGPRGGAGVLRLMKSLSRSPHLKRRALDDAEDDRRPAVVAAGRVADDLPDGGLRRSSSSPRPSAIGQQLLGDGGRRTGRRPRDQQRRGARPGH